MPENSSIFAKKCQVPRPCLIIDEITNLIRGIESQPDDLPCQNTKCLHHVYCNDIMSGRVPFKNRSGPLTESFRNCMVLLRKEEGFSMDELGEIYGVSHQIISIWIAGSLNKIKGGFERAGYDGI